MDLDDDLLPMWENDTSLQDFDAGSSSLDTYDSNNKSESLLSKDETFFKQIDEDLDYAFALSLQYNDEVKENTDINSEKSTSCTSKESKPLSIVDEQWELLDPHPDIHALFLEYDKKFFFGKLNGVVVRWSPRMTLCAGVCCYEGRGGLCSIRLSVPLLKLRPRRDLVETLLHEMIHAYLFVTHNNKDREGHGPEFLSHMNRINNETGTKISVYHSFHNEVDLYRTHMWKCDGPCQKRRPFFGIVKRAMNRAPGPKDNWWAAHQASCGGKFIKFKEPDNYKKKTVKRKLSLSESKESHSDIRNFFKDGSSASSSRENNGAAVKSSGIFDLKSILSKEENVANVNHIKIPEKKSFIPFQGTGVKLGSSSETSSVFSDVSSLLGKRELPSGSELGKILDATYSKNPKLPRISNIRVVKDVQKDQPSGIISGNVSRKFIQSPIKKFLTSGAGSTDHVKESISKSNVSEATQKNELPKVSCPVCFIMVREEDINSHLDNCLNK